MRGQDDAVIKAARRRCVIGVTGGICSGKSTVSAMLRQGGARVIDADRIAHSVIAPGRPAFRKLLKAFGEHILDKNGRINRKLLAEDAFSCGRKLALLNGITHPYIAAEIRRRLERGSGLTVLDAALLVETGLHRLADHVVLVEAPEALRLERAARARRMDGKLVSRIIAAQPAAAKAERLADFIIDNSGSLEQTKRQVERLRRQVWRN